MRSRAKGALLLLVAFGLGVGAGALGFGVYQTRAGWWRGPQEPGQLQQHVLARLTKDLGLRPDQQGIGQGNPARGRTGVLPFAGRIRTPVPRHPDTQSRSDSKRPERGPAGEVRQAGAGMGAPGITAARAPFGVGRDRAERTVIRRRACRKSHDEISFDTAISSILNQSDRINRSICAGGCAGAKLGAADAQVPQTQASSAVLGLPIGDRRIRPHRPPGQLAFPVRGSRADRTGAFERRRGMVYVPSAMSRSRRRVRSLRRLRRTKESMPGAQTCRRYSARPPSGSGV